MYKLEKYNNKQSNKIFHRIVLTLILVLSILIAYMVIQNHNIKSKTAFKQQMERQVQVNTNNEVKENWKMQADTLKDELHRQNELIVLEGKREVKYTFDYTKGEIDTNNFKWIVNKLNELKTKEISVQTTFNYCFTYDLSTLDIQPMNGKLHIILQRGSINLKPLAEDSSKRVIASETHILSGKITPQQTSSVLNITMQHTYNNIVNDNDLYNTAFMNTQTDIEELANKLGVKNIEFEVYDVGTLPNDEVEVLGDN